MEAKEAKKFQKSYFDVLGICCPSEIPLIDNILKPLNGVIEVNVIVPSRTVIVIHDDHIISQIQIVKALNSARLEANVRVYGEHKSGKKWPSPYTIASGVLVVISSFKFVFHPLQWVGLAAVALAIPPILLRSIASIRNYTLDVNILVLIAVVGAICLGDYWEAGTVVFLFTIAEWLESRASHKANAVMSSLMSMAPQKAVIAETGQVVEAKDVILDTLLAVKAGEVIPMDGVVVEGICEVDEKTLTGESLPVLKQVESSVWAGTINLNGYISVRTTALAEDCVVAKMAKLVEEAQNSKSKTQRLVDQFAKYYTPAVMLASVTLVVVPAALRRHDLRHWAHLALVVLVSACPCALILSTPVATFCAFTKAATSGILIKGGDYLEVLGKVKVVAFDKTGTITRGEFSVTDFRSIDLEVSLNSLLYWVSSIESKASHPMAAALVDYCQLNSIEPKPESVKDFQNFPGEGIHGQIDDKSIYVGNKRIAVRAGCNTVPSHGHDSKEGETIGYVFAEETLVGVFSMADTCRSGVLAAMTELKSLGIKTAMLTGDSHVAAMRVQDQLGHSLDEVHAELLPEEKVKIIKDLKKEGPTVMIGDGVNDAPALAIADIGISMGISGSALATETGHITLMSNDMRKIPQAIRLARMTLWKIRQNVLLSFVTKAAILILAFCGHPILWAAVLADVGTCLLVIFNSMLILRGTSYHRGKHHKLTSEHSSIGHGSHNGCQHPPHDKHGCGSKSHSDGHVHEQKRDPPRVCGHNEDQTCTPVSSCQTANSGVHEKNSVCLGDEGFVHAKSNNEHKCCTTVADEMPSHVIEISKIDNEVQTCKNHHSHNYEHTVCTKRDSTMGSTQVSCASGDPHNCSKSSHHKRKACHGQGHSTSPASATNHLDSKLKQACEGHASHSHDENMEHHHHHHHHRLGVALNDGIKATPTIYGGCLHNRGRHVNCQTCIPADTSITIS